MENTTPTTVITAAAIAMSTWRSASALPVRTQVGRVNRPWNAATSISKVTRNNRAATTTRMLGMTQNVVRSSSSRQLGSFRRSLSTRAGCATWISSGSLIGPTSRARTCHGAAPPAPPPPTPAGVRGMASATSRSSSASSARARCLTMSSTSGCSSGFHPSSSSVRPSRRASVNRSNAAVPFPVEIQVAIVSASVFDHHARRYQPVQAGLEHRGIDLQTRREVAHSACGRVGQAVQQPHRARRQVEAGPVGQRRVELLPVLPRRHPFQGELDLLQRRPGLGRPVHLPDVHRLHRLAQRDLREQEAEQEGDERDRDGVEEDDVDGVCHRIDVLGEEDQPRRRRLQLVQQRRVERLRVETSEDGRRDRGQRGRDGAR